MEAGKEELRQAATAELDRRLRAMPLKHLVGLVGQLAPAEPPAAVTGREFWPPAPSRAGAYARISADRRAGRRDIFSDRRDISAGRREAHISIDRRAGRRDIFLARRDTSPDRRDARISPVRRGACISADRRGVYPLCSPFTSAVCIPNWRVAGVGQREFMGWLRARDELPRDFKIYFPPARRGGRRKRAMLLFASDQDFRTALRAFAEKLSWLKARPHFGRAPSREALDAELETYQRAASTAREDFPGFAEAPDRRERGAPWA